MRSLVPRFISIGFSRGPCRSAESAPALNEVVITGTYRPAAEIDVPASVSVLDATTLREAGQQHLEDVLALVPNLNWAGDTSRPRYFQIRGIGELEQYQGAPNPSVGLLIDDIDFSGLGGAATLFDVDHIEVLRGRRVCATVPTRWAVSFTHKARSLQIQWADTLSWVQATTVSDPTARF